jgi:hypothetical protein
MSEIGRSTMDRWSARGLIGQENIELRMVEFANTPLFDMSQQNCPKIARSIPLPNSLWIVSESFNVRQIGIVAIACKSS